MVFCLDSMGLKRGPLIVDRGTSKIKHRLCAIYCPTHPRPFHSIFHNVAACSFDLPAGNRITGPEILVVTHPLAIAGQVVADLRQLFSLFRGQAALAIHQADHRLAVAASRGNLTCHPRKDLRLRVDAEIALLISQTRPDPFVFGKTGRLLVVPSPRRVAKLLSPPRARRPPRRSPAEQMLPDSPPSQPVT